jgi:four helix bundle protein
MSLFHIFSGSSLELETQLIIAQKRNNILETQLKSIEEKTQEFQKMTLGFQNKL